MKRILLLFIFFCPSLIFSQEGEFIHGDLIVMYNSPEGSSLICNELGNINGTATHLQIKKTISSSMNIYLMSFDPEAVNETLFLRAVRNNHLVILAQFNHIIQERVVPNDSLFASQWDMNNTGATGGTADADIDAPEAWDITTGGLTSDGDSIVVAIIDGGFDLTHQDLDYWRNYNEIPGNSTDDDGNGYVDDVRGWNSDTGTDVIPSASHGTHVAGAAGARGNNSIGVTGVNWNVKIMALSYGSTSSLAELEANAVGCYAYARDQRYLYNTTNGAKGAFVVSTNSSFGIDNGLPSTYPVWCAMFDSLGAVGILSAAATANHNWNIDVTGDIPTSCTSNWLVTVTNTTNTDAKNGGAAYGPTTIDLGAPGSGTLSTVPGTNYSTMTGTSMASPHVAGAIALMYSVPCTQFMLNYKSDPAGTALIIKDSLLGATDLNNDLSTGFPTVTGGRLNLYKSVRAVQNYCFAVGITEEEQNSGLNISSVYPNPATNEITVVYNSFSDCEISVTNVLGQEVKRIQGDRSTKGVQHGKINIASLDKGIYFVSVTERGKKSNVVKVIIY